MMIEVSPIQFSVIVIVAPLIDPLPLHDDKNIIMNPFFPDNASNVSLDHVLFFTVLFISRQIIPAIRRCPFTPFQSRFLERQLEDPAQFQAWLTLRILPFLLALSHLTAKSLHGFILVLSAAGIAACIREEGARLVTF
jgi:hypothetical protein